MIRPTDQALRIALRGSSDQVQRRRNGLLRSDAWQRPWSQSSRELTISIPKKCQGSGVTTQTTPTSRPAEIQSPPTTPITDGKNCKNSLIAEAILRKPLFSDCFFHISGNREMLILLVVELAFVL